MKWVWELLQLLWVYLTNPPRETEVEKNRETEMSLDFDGLKEAAKEALEDSGYKEELETLLDEYKDLFVDEAKGYLKGVVATFKGDEYDPEKYAQFVATLDDDQLIAEAAATADEIAGLVATYTKKKQFLEDLKSSASTVARKALVAGLTAYVGPAVGPLAGLLSS